MTVARSHSQNAHKDNTSNLRNDITQLKIMVAEMCDAGIRFVVGSSELLVPFCLCFLFLSLGVAESAIVLLSTMLASLLSVSRSLVTQRSDGPSEIIAYFASFSLSLSVFMTTLWAKQGQTEECFHCRTVVSAFHFGQGTGWEFEQCA